MQQKEEKSLAKFNAKSLSWKKIPDFFASNYWKLKKLSKRIKGNYQTQWKKNMAKHATMISARIFSKRYITAKRIKSIISQA